MVEIVALIIAAAWGFYVFVYQERIKPAIEEPNVQSVIDVSHAPAGRNKEVVQVEWIWKNLGTVDAQIDGYILNVYGVHYSDAAPHLHPEPRNEISVPHGYVKPIVRTRDPAGTRTLLLSHFKPWMPLGGYLRGPMTPGTELRAYNSVVVGRGEFDTVVVVSAYCYRRRDDPFQMHFEAPLAPDGSYTYDSMMKAERAVQKTTKGCFIWTDREYAI